MVDQQPIIELEGVSKTYGEGLLALDGLTVDVMPGAVGLLGPNGAGKSTLIKTLLGLVQLSSGSARVLGLDVETDSVAIRQRVGYMPEDDCIFAGLKGVESVAYCAELAGLPHRTSLRRAHEILEFVGLHEERYREVQTYSTGMKQRIRLAQAIVHAPTLLLLDEPTSGLDPAAREKILRLIRNLSHDKGMSVVFSTHILKDIAACCDAALMIENGRLLAYDTLERFQQVTESSLRIETTGDAGAFADALERQGCTVDRQVNGWLQVTHGGLDISDVVFRTADETNALLRQVQPVRSSLEEAFLDRLAK
ncbi:MAG: ABC transporter ATP-binding protein [Pirellulales bacterium]|nr:ABC transporter ATP-binding protein [Pirellulales bacterium]